MTTAAETILASTFSMTEAGGGLFDFFSLVQYDFTPVLWIPFITNETITVAFVIGKAYRSYRFLRSDRLNTSTLLDTLIQHSLLYYFSCVSSLAFLACIAVYTNTSFIAFLSSIWLAWCYWLETSSVWRASMWGKFTVYSVNLVIDTFARFILLLSITSSFLSWYPAF